MAVRGIAGLLTFMLCCASGYAQNFPVKPIRIVVPTIAGSAPDVRVRQVTSKLADAFGQPVLVENRPGANGTIAAQFVAKAPPDGYTVFFALINNAINDLLHPASCCRLNQELMPVTQFALTPLVLVVHPSVPAANLQAYLRLAKAKPGLLTYGSAGSGSITQLVGEWVRLKAGASILEVPYKSVGAELPDLLGGQITTAYLNPIVIADYVNGGRLRGLAVTGSTRLPSMPNVPTIAEAGLPGVEASVWNGYFVPAGTPPGVIQTLNREFIRAFSAPDVREQAAASGSIIVGGPPEEFAAFIRAEIEKFRRVMKEAGIKAQ